jgi:hypothetical protein
VVGASIDWRRIGRRFLIVQSAVLAVLLVYLSAKTGHYGSDFRGGAWKAGHDVLAGRSPYAPPVVSRLIALRSAFIPPPLLALIAVPFAALPFAAAVVLWSLVCSSAFAGALFLLGVRDWRFYLVAFCSYPFVASLMFGQPDGLLALAAACAWRYRDSPRGAVAVGALIAAKLVAWPLVLWLVATKRLRGALLAVASTVGFLAFSWAAIGFNGLASYPQLLSADARAFGSKSYSPVAEIMRLGGSASLAQVLAVILAAAVLLGAVRVTRGSDRGWFAGAVAFGLLASPLLEICYLVLLFVPLAIGRRRPEGIVWIATALWLAPWALWPAHLRAVQLAIVITLVTSVAVLAGRSPVRVSRLAGLPAG